MPSAAAAGDQNVARELLLFRHPLLSSDQKAMSARLDAERESIVHRSGQILLASDVPLGGLNRGMYQKELDLLQFAAADMAQSRAGPPEVIGCQCHDCSPGRTSLNDVPDDI